MKIQEIISNIQDKIFDKNTDEFHLEYSQIGYVECINLHIWKDNYRVEVELWNSEMESREYIEEINEYEDFETFLLRIIEEILMSFTELKSILINEYRSNV